MSRLTQAAVVLVVLIQAASLRAGLPPGDYVKKIRVDGEQREFRLHIPKSCAGMERRPVVLVFHGLSASAKLIQKVSEMDQQADACGFIAVYPDGSGFALAKGFRAGNSQRSEAKRPDDVRFVHCILNYLERNACSDPCRVYATGLSNGAMMCYRLATEMPQRIAAIAPISGCLGTECRRPRCPISIMHFHGTCDEVLPYNGPSKDGAFQQSFYSVPCTIAMFARVADCLETKTVETLPNPCQDGTRAYLDSYRNEQTGVEINLVRIVGGGHQWPQRALPFRYLGAVSEDINANQMMWCFFQRHVNECCESPEKSVSSQP